MKFLNILKTIGEDSLKVVNAASPVANIFVPGVGTAIGAVTSLVIAAENHPSPAMQAPGSGAVKSQWVVDTFTALFPVIQAFAASQGENITCDTSQLQPLINGIVATFNAASALHLSITKVAK